jgi:parallel beta-helix repeat protein
VFAFDVEPAKAVLEEIVINPNGTISSPVTANITVSNNVYTFNGSNYLPIVVNRSNIIINGMGHTLQASGSYDGFSLSSVSKVTIENTTIQNGAIGIYLNYSSDNTLSGNNVMEHTYGYGIDLQSSSDNTFSGNNVTINSYGIVLFNSSNNVFSRNNVTASIFDGVDLYSSSNNTLSGNNVTANSDYGVYLESSSNNTLSGNTVTANGYGGIDLESCDNNTLSGNTVTVNSGGVYLYGSSGNALSGNTITDSGDGFSLWYCDNNTLSGNYVTANSYDGIEIDFSSGNTLSGNVMANNTYNFGIQGDVLSDFMNNVSTSNLVNDKPVYYWINKSNTTISPQNYSKGIGYLGLVNCKNVTVQGLTLPENIQGLLLAYTNDSTITHNNFMKSSDGADLYYSSRDILSGNNLTNDGYEGAYLYSSANCTVSRNNMTDNGDCGVYVDAYCNYTTATGNNMANNGYEGIYFYSSLSCTVSGNNVTNNGDCGVYVDAYCNYTTVSGNNIASNINEGVYLYSSSNCTISGNNVTSNGYGVGFASSSANTFYHNNFINNTQQVSSDGSPNNWDSGYPSGGNYWSDYRTANPSAIENDSSALWNTPYVIDSNNTDRYPLMGPFQTFSVGTWNGTAYSVDTVSNSTLSNFIFNPSTKTLTFDVTDITSATGFCRVAIPTGLMWSDNPPAGWLVYVEGTLYNNQTIIQSGNYTYIYFTYTQGTKTVQITSTSAVPEFQPFMLLPLFMIITLLGAIVVKRKRNAKK